MSEKFISNAPAVIDWPTAIHEWLRKGHGAPRGNCRYSLQLVERFFDCDAVLRTSPPLRIGL
jgi:hypothetical protein